MLPLPRVFQPALPPQSRRSQQSGDLSFLEEDAGGSVSVRELRAAHAETIQELQKTRNLLRLESRISRDYKVQCSAPPVCF